LRRRSAATSSPSERCHRRTEIRLLFELVRGAAHTFRLPPRDHPINGDGSSIFKLGSTVPVKFALTGASASITNLVAKIYVAKLSNGIEGSLVEATSNGAADAGNTFRYSGDGVEHAIHISLR
jgi:hypothetical protein